MQQTIPVPNELIVPIEIHQQNRTKLLGIMKKELGDKVNNAIILLQGVVTIPIDDQDTEYQTQQESNFWYLFGVSEPDCSGIIETETGKTILFVPKVDDGDRMWMVVKDKSDYLKQYKVDEVYFVTEMENYFNKNKRQVIYIYDGVNTDSNLNAVTPKFTFLEGLNLDRENLFQHLQESRATKSDEELRVLRFICKVSSEGHEKVMQNISAGNKEYQIEALFKYHGQSTCGARFQAYDCICGSGRNASTLHYTVNDKILQADSLVLCDMGSKYYGYCSDLTVTFPISGKFNCKQRIVYNAVLQAQQEVFKVVKPGVNWGECHLIAERTIVSHLHKAGLLVGDLDEINKARIGSLFFPHGLGHLLGLNVHDVGGYINSTPARSQEPGLKNLRTRRNLTKGLVLTNEPGCYFIEFILKAAYENPDQSKYLNRELIEQFMDVGGVRLEDDFVVTEDGYEILSDLPRTIEEVESCMRGEEWRKLVKSDD